MEDGSAGNLMLGLVGSGVSGLFHGGLAGRVSPLTLIALPLAFTAAMTLCDSINGVATAVVPFSNG